MSKSFPYYLSQLHKIIKNYENKMDREKKLQLRLDESERKAPLTEEEKKRLNLEGETS